MNEKQEETQDDTKVKQKKIHVVLFASDIVELVIMVILAAALIGGALFLYFFDVGSIFKIDDVTVPPVIKSFSAPALISGLSLILFISYRTLDTDDRTWLKVLLHLLYFCLTAGVLYFNWYNCEKLFSTFSDDRILNAVWRYIMWANSVSCGLCFFLYYFICVHFREWSKPWDVIVTILMITFLPAFILIGFAVASIGAVVGSITLAGKAVDRFAQSIDTGSSSGDTYTIRHASGYEETVHSSNGSDFYDSTGRYVGHKDD